MKHRARTPQNKHGRRTDPRTVAELLHYFRIPQLRQELEEFRIDYEKEFGETDLTKRYTSTWPTEHQEWLLEHHPKRYFDGLPPFVKAFIKAKMLGAAECGNLDDAPSSYLRLYIAGDMNLDAEGRNSGDREIG